MQVLTRSKTGIEMVELETGLIVPASSIRRDSPYLARTRKFYNRYLDGLARLAQQAQAQMDMQGFVGAPIIDPPVAPLGALSATTIEDMWPGITWTPIFANDARAGKCYHVRMFGTVSLTGGTAIITPQWGPAATTLGVSLTQGTVTIAITGMYLAFDLFVQSIGAAGANSKVTGAGFWNAGGGVVSGTANPNMVTFGGTQASVDATINGNITIRKTLSATNSFIVQYVAIRSQR